jgi:serine/threonine-protein kinase RsbW
VERAGVTAEHPPDLEVEATVPALASRVASVRRAVATIARRAGFEADRVDDIALAVSEVLTNAVVHAYRDQDDAGALHLTAHVDESALYVQIVDHGLGFARRDDSPGLGLGLALASMVADELRIGPAEPRGTLVRLRFDC